MKPFLPVNQLQDQAKFGNNFASKSVEQLSDCLKPYLIIGIYDQI